MIERTTRAANYALLSFRRNPAATFFTVIFPLLFLIIFGFVFGGAEVGPPGEQAPVETFIVPGILGLSIVSATFVNLAMGQVIRREAGQLKRLRGTPLTPLEHSLGQIIASFVIVVIMTIVVTVLGWLFFGVNFNLGSLGVFIPTIALGSMAFSALGIAVTAIIPNEDSAPAITNAIVLPLYFISDVFIFSDDTGSDEDSGFIARLGDFFPVKPLVESLQPSYNPFVESFSIPWAKWGVVAAWGVVGLIGSIRFFLWVPQNERR